MDSRTKEFVWTAKLSKKDKVAKWGGDKEGILEQIILKLAVLGPGAVKGERNLVQVTTFDSEQNKITACVSALTVGLKEDQQLADLTLFPPAQFTLIEGSGPVHIVGNHVVLDEDDLSDEDLSEFDEDEIEDLREKLKARGVKNEKGDAPVKSKKVKGDDDDEEEDDDDEDLDEEDDDDDDDEEEAAPSKKEVEVVEWDEKKNAFIQAEAADEDDDDFEDMEDDSEEDDDEEEKVLEQITSKKRKLENGKGSRQEPQKKKPTVEKMTSPDRGSKNVPEQKTPKSQKDVLKTPKSEKKTPSKAKAPTSIEEVKAAIKKYPGGKPRKEDKFINWVTGQFKVTDDLWKGELWKWHKKEIGL